MRTIYWNGSNIQAAIKSLKLARKLCVEIEKQLTDDGVVHPRDYIGGKDSHEFWADFCEYRRLMHSLRELEQHCERRTMELYTLAAQNDNLEAQP